MDVPNIVYFAHMKHSVVYLSWQLWYTLHSLKIFRQLLHRIHCFFMISQVLGLCSYSHISFSYSAFCINDLPLIVGRSVIFPCWELLYFFYCVNFTNFFPLARWQKLVSWLYFIFENPVIPEKWNSIDVVMP